MTEFPCLEKLNRYPSLIPEEKDFKRIRDIIKKSKGNRDKIISLAITMAKRIEDIHKSARRAIAADIIAREILSELEFDIFLALINSIKLFLNRIPHNSDIKYFIKDNYKFCSIEDSINETSTTTLII